MSRRSNNNRNRRAGRPVQVRRSTDAEMTKAAVPGVGPGAQVYTAQQVAALMSAGLAPQTTGAFNPLPRLDPQVAFGPGLALIPAAIDPVRRDTGRPEPRFTDYPPTVNLPGVTDKLVPWKVLRDAAAAGGVPRRCIQIRKEEVAQLEWAITITKDAVTRAQADNPSASRADVETDLRKRLGPEIARCTAFWERPDPGQDEDWPDWISKLLEEHLVLDAVAIYPRRTYGGSLYSLEIIDGSTIKVLRDFRGGKPLPPGPAYQQMLWGFPRGEWVADVDADGEIHNGYGADTLIYKRRNVRAETPYGYSAVEQCLEDLDVWLRRRQWIRAEYSDGTIPNGLLRNTGAANGWTPAQVLEYEIALNDTWSGQTLERHRMRVLPPGFELETSPDVAERYKPEYDLFLLKQLASHFATTIAELNFTEAGGLGSSGYHEGQADIKERTATAPTYRWIQGLCTGISRRHLRMPSELEFRILGLEQEDEAAADAVAQERIANGRMTLNEDRDRLGLARYPFPEADKPMLMTARGIVFIEGASLASPPGVLVEPAQAPKDAAAADSGAVSDGDTDQDGDDGDATDGGGGRGADAAKADGADLARCALVRSELAAFERWSRRNQGRRNLFQFKVVTKAEAPDLEADVRVLFAEPPGAEGESPPKAGAPRPWPGRERAKTTAADWVRPLIAAMRAGVDTGALARDWLSNGPALPAPGEDDRPPAPDDTGRTVTWLSYKTDTATRAKDAWRLAAILAWLHGRGLAVDAALAPVLDGMWTDGYALGARAAANAVTGRARPWTWKPGDRAGAAASLDTTQLEGLAAYSAVARQWTDSITAHRLDVLAKVLDRAQGLTAPQLAAALTHALGDPGWAGTVAATEVMRAAMAATDAEYLRAAVPAVQWMATGKNPCANCLANAAAGPLPTGSVFPSGDYQPPGHPECGCELWACAAVRAAAR